MTSRLDRLIAIDEQIRRGEFPNIDHLCKVFEVAPRTIYQDIKELRENLGLDIRFDKLRNGYFNANPKKALPDFALTDEESFLLVLAEGMLCHYAGTSFKGTLDSALHKIFASPGTRAMVSRQDVNTFVRFLSGSATQISRKLFLNLYDACSRRLLLDIVHTDREQSSECFCTIEPYRIVHIKERWELLGFNRTVSQFCRIALPEIQRLQVQETQFEQRELLPIEQWLPADY